MGAYPHPMLGLYVYRTAAALERLLADMGVEEDAAIDERTLFAHDFPTIGILLTSDIRTGDSHGETEVARLSRGADLDDVGKSRQGIVSIVLRCGRRTRGARLGPHGQVMRRSDHSTARNRVGVTELWLWPMSRINSMNPLRQVDRPEAVYLFSRIVRECRIYREENGN